MVIGAVTVFFASLAGITGLFSLKLWEERRETVAVSGIRGALDTLAIRCKQLLLAGEELFSRLPSVTTFVAMNLLALSAVWFAQMARKAAEASHRLADFVSHKHNFERRETRSDFLKQVSDHHKNGNGSANLVTPNLVQDTESVVAQVQNSKRRKLVRDIDVRG